MTRLETTALAVGGDAVARDASGRVVFVTGALPGEVVDVDVVEERRRHARAVVRAVHVASPDRVVPPCAHRREGCGGCDQQHVAPAALVALKRGSVVEALTRIGGLVDPPVRAADPLPTEGFRTTVRAGVVDGRAGLRRSRRHDLVHPERCLVAHPLIDELLVEGRFGEAAEVTLRVGAGTGERLALLRPTAEGVRLPPEVVVVGADEVRDGRRAWYHDEVEGRRFRISATSFFQSRTDGAAALVREVAAALDVAGGGLDGARVVDAYGGVGLFAAHLAPTARAVTLVERSPSSVVDARRNLAGSGTEVVRAAVERWRPSPAEVVVADPARPGLGRAAVEVLAATGARRLVLVSCDAGALGRDAGLLAAAGYELVGAALVDLFPHTHHVEVISTFQKAGS